MESLRFWAPATLKSSAKSPDPLWGLLRLHLELPPLPGSQNDMTSLKRKHLLIRSKEISSVNKLSFHFHFIPNEMTYFWLEKTWKVHSATDPTDPTVPDAIGKDLWLSKGALLPHASDIQQMAHLKSVHFNILNFSFCHPVSGLVFATTSFNDQSTKGYKDLSISGLLSFSVRALASKGMSSIGTSTWAEQERMNRKNEHQLVPQNNDLSGLVLMKTEVRSSCSCYHNKYHEALWHAERLG